MEQQEPGRIAPNTTTSRVLLILAQLLALLALGIGLLFVVNTSGGTLFLFSSISPLLVIVSAIIVLGVALDRFRKRHSLFDHAIFEPGQVIFHQGEMADCSYFIQSGRVEVLREENGEGKVLAQLSSGEYFGEMALLSNQPRNATVRAVTTTRLALVGKENFLAMLRVLPSTRTDILKTVQKRAMSSVSQAEPPALRDVD
jgi:cyclic nucleotide-binding protein